MKIALLGDMAFFGRMSVNENPRTDEYFSEVADYLKGFDCVVGNLETPFSEKKKTFGAKSAYICADVENVRTLKQLHVNAVCLANNHMFDYGTEGYETTKRVLGENGIEFFGAEGKELRVEAGGCKVAFSGFCCYTSNPLKCVRYGEYGVNAYNIEKVRQVLKHNTNEGYLNIVAVHAGMEHVNYPSIEHVRAARLLAEVCPYVYYGHHPHVIQGFEEYKGAVIAHSLGNFCFDDVYSDKSSKPLVELTENNRTGAILELEVGGNKILNWREQIVYIAKDERMKLIETPAELTEYNGALATCEGDSVAYTSKRNQFLSARFSERKSARNLMWYMKRLRPRYVQIMLNARKNAKKYNENVLKYIQND